MKSNFPSFVRKESLHILRDRRSMLIIMLIPVVLMALFGFAISTEVNNVRVAVVAQERTDAVRDDVERIAANDYFTFCGYTQGGDVGRLLRAGEVSAVVVFKPGYNELAQRAASGEPQPPLIQLILDASNVNTAQAAAAYLQNVLQGSASPQQLFETRMLFNPQMKSAFNFVPGIMGLIFILVCAMMTSVSIVREKETGTMEVLLVSPVRPIRIIFAKMIPYFAVSVVVLIMILLLARYLLGVPLTGGVAGIFALSLLYIVLSLGLGLLVSTLVRTQIAALIISAMLLMMPMMMLSGMLFPIENMPAFFRWFSTIIPARWYIDAIRKMMIQGVAITQVWAECLILLVMTVTIFVVAIRNFKDRL